MSAADTYWTLAETIGPRAAVAVMTLCARQGAAWMEET